MDKKETDLHLGNGSFMNIKTSQNVKLYEQFIYRKRQSADNKDYLPQNFNPYNGLDSKNEVVKSLY